MDSCPLPRVVPTTTPQADLLTSSCFAEYFYLCSKFVSRLSPESNGGALGLPPFWHTEEDSQATWQNPLSADEAESGYRFVQVENRSTAYKDPSAARGFLK